MYFKTLRVENCYFLSKNLTYRKPTGLDHKAISEAKHLQQWILIVHKYLEKKVKTADSKL